MLAIRGLSGTQIGPRRTTRRRRAAVTPWQWILAFSWCIMFWSPGPAHASDRPEFGPAPDWVLPTAVPEVAIADVPRELLQDGVYNLLVDRQTRAGRGALQQYRHIVSRALSLRAVETLAQVDIDFDPSFQRLRIHHIGIWRDGRWLSRLHPARVRVLQQERDLRRLVYDGTRTAHALLDDVRVGDVVDFAYTLTGHNPVFGEAHFGGFPMQWRTPVRQVQARLLWPAGRALQEQSPDLARPERVAGPPGWDEYRWQAVNVPGISVRKDTPDAYLPTAHVHWSGITDWASVVQWARPLYATTAVHDGELHSVLETIARRHVRPADRAMAVLQFVQENIRYMAIAVGEGSYAPRQPASVMAQRFGDCKDKTLLALTMLRALGIEAHAALVNTRIGDAVAARLPTPSAFDHVVLRVRVDGQDFWLDPTKSTQHGTLDTISQASQSHALVIAEGARELATIVPAPANTRRKLISLVYAAPAGDRSAMNLMVKTDYEGLAAEEQRSYLADEGTALAQKSFLEFYQRAYRTLHRIQDFTVEDDLDRNRLRIVEHYRIEDFWSPGEGAEAPGARIRMPDIRAVLKSPSMPREQPFAQEHAVEVEHTTVLHLPEAWPVRDGWLETVDNPAFSLRAEFRSSARELVWNHHYRSRKSAVAVDELPTYVADIDRADDLAFDTATRTAPRKDAGGTTRAWIVMVTVPLVLCAMLFAANRRRLAETVPASPLGNQPRTAWLHRSVIGVERTVLGLTRLYLRPRRYFANAQRLESRPALWLAAALLGLITAAGFLDWMLEWARESADGGGLRLAAESWQVYWACVMVFWAVGIAAEWYAGAWWFRQRLQWSGVPRSASGHARGVHVHQSLVPALPVLAYNLAATAWYEDWNAATSAMHVPAAVLLTIACASSWTSYVAATRAFPCAPKRAAWWFGILPLLYYGIFLAGVIALLYQAG